MIEPFDESVPGGDEVTEYDRTHLKLYLRLLDAETEGADWREAVTVLFGIDPLADPQRASSVHASHLQRAHWMTRKGYLGLLRKNRD